MELGCKPPKGSEKYIIAQNLRAVIPTVSGEERRNSPNLSQVQGLLISKLDLVPNGKTKKKDLSTSEFMLGCGSH